MKTKIPIIVLALLQIFFTSCAERQIEPLLAPFLPIETPNTAAENQTSVGQEVPKQSSEEIITPLRQETETASDEGDPLGMVFSTRMTIMPDGEPLIAIGVMEGQDEIRITSKSPLKILTFGKIKKEINLHPGEKALFALKSSKPADVRYFPILANIIWGEQGELKKVLEEWKTKGISTDVVTVGAVNGITGQVLDNRTWLVIVKGSGEKEWAEKMGEELFERFGIRTALHETLLKRPQAEINIGDSQGFLSETSDLAEISVKDDTPLELLPAPRGVGISWEDGKPRKYAGKIIVTVDKTGKLTAVNLISLSRYLMGVVPSETYASAPMEALKSQAVAARGYILSQLGTKHLADPYHLCADIRCQVYGGIDSEHPRTTQAIQETKGEVLFHSGHLVESSFSANAGGYTENNETVWQQAPSKALRGKADLIQGDYPPPGKNNKMLYEFINNPPKSYSAIASIGATAKSRWEKTFSAYEFNRLVAPLGIGDLKNITVTGRGVSGRVKGVKLTGTKKTKVILYELTVRRLFDNLPSGLFYIVKKKAKNGALQSVSFHGAGWGHGVGMCQTGAIGRAEAKQTYKEILQFYYNGAEVTKLY